MTTLNCRKGCGALLFSIFALTLLPPAAQAHAIVGDRVFPVTLAIDDPGVADEATLPQITRFKSPDEDGAEQWETDSQFEISKTITENFALSVSGLYKQRPNANGWDNFGTMVKYQLYKSAEHQFMTSVGLDWDMGGTGAKHIGTERYSTLTPTLFFGKGFGDIGNNPLSLLRPFALTGSLGYGMPTKRHNADGSTNPDTVNWGFSVQYSLPYLEQHVRDTGLAEPFRNMTPLVEFSMKTPTNQNGGNRTTGTINPGLIWSGEKTQYAVEAVMPLNRASGSGVGVTAQVHVFFDDLFPDTLGKPLW